MINKQIIKIIIIISHMLAVFAFNSLSLSYSLRVNVYLAFVVAVVVRVSPTS